MEVLQKNIFLSKRFNTCEGKKYFGENIIQTPLTLGKKIVFLR